MARRLPALAVVVFIALAAFAPTLAASGGLYALDKLGISISMPVEALVFTRDVEENDPDLAAVGYTRDGMLTLMKSANSYLISIEPNGKYEIGVMMVDGNVLYSLSAYDEEQINGAVDTLVERLEQEDGVAVSSCEAYDSGVALFMKVMLTCVQNGRSYYALEYVTIYNGKNICIRLLSYTDGITSEQETVMKTVVDGIRFNEGDPKAENSSLIEKINNPATICVVTVILVAVIVVAVAKRKSKRPKAKISAARQRERYEAPGVMESSASEQTYSAVLDARLQGVQGGPSAQGGRDQNELIARRCPFCGEDLVPGSVFCGECGQRLEEK
ncbi:MAG TPA: zinc ribbon domain-containing protein [Clostridia bacterium]|nr:zinc ribbon domain-containing protein [Clostridia bacterium]